METTPTKRGASRHDGDRSKKRAKLGGDANGSAAPGGSFAARMMAKMGYQKGQGLGREGTGIINPIEVKLRPQGAGVGAVKEKTAQAKAEERRVAEQGGEKFEESSDEERRTARRRRKDPAGPVSSGRQTPVTRPKQKIRTAAEIEAEEGLPVPSVFKSLIDHTGQQPKLLTSTAGLLMTPSATSETEISKIAVYARRELDAFAGSWHALQERKEFTVLQVQQLQIDIEKQEAETLNMRSVANVVDAILSLCNHSRPFMMTFDELEEQLDALTMKLEEIQLKFADDLQRFDMAEIAVAALQPLFKTFISLWHPFEEPLRMVPYLHRLRAILSIDQGGENVVDDDDDFAQLRPRRMTSPYESLVYTQWLPKVRTSIVNDWETSDPTPMLSLVAAWKDVVPSQIYDVLINQLIAQKLADSVKAWKPQAASSSRKHISEPSTWIFPWLEHLDEYHLDPRSSNGLLSEVKRKFRTAFSTWNPSKGLIQGVSEWQGLKVFRGELNHALDMYLLPALARYLHDHFEVDPSNQDVTPIEKVLLWSPLFSAEKFSRVFIDAFFPKWLNVLHLWLVSDPNYEEIGAWYTWWQTQVPEVINQVSSVAAEWEKGLEMINRALDLGPDRVKTHLAPPKAGPRRPILEDAAKLDRPGVAPETRPAAKAPNHSEVTFKDELESMCKEEGLFILPLGIPHPKNGLQLWRITTTIPGTGGGGGGGTVFYVQGDVMWVQNKSDNSIWEPMDVYAAGALAMLAEGQ